MFQNICKHIFVCRSLGATCASRLQTFVNNWCRSGHPPLNLWRLSIANFLLHHVGNCWQQSWSDRNANQYFQQLHLPFGWRMNSSSIANKIKYFPLSVQHHWSEIIQMKSPLMTSWHSLCFVNDPTPEVNDSSTTFSFIASMLFSEDDYGKPFITEISCAYEVHL